MGVSCTASRQTSFPGLVILDRSRCLVSVADSLTLSRSQRSAHIPQPLGDLLCCVDNRVQNTEHQGHGYTASTGRHRLLPLRRMLLQSFDASPAKEKRSPVWAGWTVVRALPTSRPAKRPSFADIGVSAAAHYTCSPYHFTCAGWCSFFLHWKISAAAAVMIRAWGVVRGKEGERYHIILPQSVRIPRFLSPITSTVVSFMVAGPSTAVTQPTSSLPVAWHKTRPLPYTKGWPARDPGRGNRLADGAAGSRSLVHLSVDRLFATGHPLATSDCFLGSTALRLS